MLKIFKKIKHQLHRFAIRFKRKILFINWNKFKLPGLILLGFLILLGLFFWARQLPPRAPNFKKSEASSYSFEAKNKVFQAKFGIREQQPMVTFNVDGDKSVTLSYQGNDNSQATIDSKGKNLTFKDVEPNMDIQYKTLANGIKEEIVLHQARQKENNANVFLFNGNFQDAYPKEIIKGISGVGFYDEQNNYLFHFEKPFAIDAAGNRTDNVVIQIENKNDSKVPEVKNSIDGETAYVIRLTVDETWLNDPVRTYPIIIDPTIVHDESSEFSIGQLDRVKDTGSGSSPSLESFYQELGADINTAGLWHFNETSGNALDSSGNSNTGTPTGTTIVDGLLSKARSFSGSGQYITVPNSASLNPTDSITIEAWIYLSAANTNNGLVYKGSFAGSQGIYSFGFFSGSNNSLTFRLNGSTGLGNGQVSGSTSLALNTWYHVAAVYDKSLSQQKIYVNGVEDGSQPYGVAISTDTNNLIIGGYYSSSYLFNGVMDEVRVSNVARTPEEIRLNASRRPYSTFTSNAIDLTSVNAWNSLSWTGTGLATSDGETPASSTGLVAQWNFNETSGVTAVSGGTCGTSCNGTLTNMTTTSQDAAAMTGWTANNRRWGAGALMFDGSNDYVNAGSDSSIDNITSKTFCTWINLRTQIGSDSAGSHIINKGDLWFIATDPANSRNIYGQNFSTTNGRWSFPLMQTGQWNHLCAVYDRSSTSNDPTIYVNGVAQPITEYSTPVGSASDDSSNSLSLGSSIPNGRWLAGSLDGAQLYSRALTASEVLSNYNSSRIELQTRVGTSSDPNDGTWEAWKPTTAEAIIDSLDNSVDQWTIDSYQNSSSTISKIGTINVGSGNDGACTVSSGTTTLSTGSCAGRGTADAVNFASTVLTGAGATSITVSTTPTGLTAGDEVLIINLQGTSTNYDRVGQYETHTIASISTNTLNFTDSPLQNTYDGTTQKIMVQRVPNYTNVTVSSGAILTTGAWDGTKGGVLFFRASGAVSNAGTITMTGLGYRGGTAAVGCTTGGKGESLNGNLGGGDGKDGYSIGAGGTGVFGGGGGGGSYPAASNVVAKG
ncbi:MAG: hypothetical protein US20_C0032G0002, partial [Candidatus Pacebacteria bacterium GW2011_GWF1_36_5]